MADGTKISALAVGAAIDGSELVPVVQAGGTVRLSLTTVLGWFKSQLTRGDVGLGNVENTPVALTMIRDAIRAVRDRNRFKRTPWLPNPQWLPSTAYVLYQRVTNAGFTYVCTTAGTSAASGGPTITAPGSVADGSVTWFFVDKAYGADANAPTYTTSATAPASPPRCYTSSKGTAANSVTATAAVRSDTWFEWGGGVLDDSTSTYGWGNFVGGTNTASISFMCDDPSPTFKTKGLTYMITVDGRPLMAGPAPVILPASNPATSYLTLNFADIRPREITIHFDIGANTKNFNGIYLSSAESSCWPVSRTSSLKAAILDSSTGLNTGNVDSIQFGVAARIFAALGVTGFIDAVGGSGIAAGGSLKYINRLAALVPYAPDFLILRGSTNDAAIAAATVQQETTDLIAQARVLLGPKVYIIVTGIQYTSTPGLNAAETAIAAAVTGARITDQRVVFMPVATDPAGSWWTTSNNARYNSMDASNHPNLYGHVFVGDRFGEGLAKTLLRLPTA